MQVGLGTGAAVITPLMFGDSPTRQGIAEAFAQSLLLGEPRYKIFGAHTAAAIATEEAAKDQQQQDTSNAVENPASVYGPPAPPELTPEQRGDISVLAAKTATSAPLDAADSDTHKLVTQDPAAQAFFEQEKQGYAQAIVAKVAGAAPAGAGSNAEAGTPPAPAAATPPPAEAPAAVPAVPLPAPAEPLSPVNETAPISNPTEAAALPAAVIPDALHSEAGEPIATVKDSLTDQTPPVPAADAGSPNVVTPPAPPEPVAKESLPTAAPTPPPAPPEPPKPPAPEWTKHQGDPNALLEQMRDVAEAGKIAVAKGGTKDVAVTGEAYLEQQLARAADLREAGKVDEANEIVRGLRAKNSDADMTKAVAGLGQKRAALYEDVSRLPAAEAKAAIGEDKQGDAKGNSRKLGVFLSPDGTHVLLGAVTSSTKNGQRTVKVAAYDAGLGQRKSPKGTHYPTDYDTLVAAGWKPLASLKSDYPSKSFFATYSLDQWRDVEAGLRDIKSTSQRTTEAMMGHLAASPDYGRGATPETEHPTGDEAPEGASGHAENGTDKVAPEVKPEDVRAFTPDHAEAIVEAVKGLKPEAVIAKDPAQFMGALKQAGADAVQGFKVLVRQVADLAKESPDFAVDYARRLIYENTKRPGGASAEELAKSAALGGDKTNSAGAGPGRPEPAGRAAAAGDQPVAGGAPAGAAANGGGGGEGKPAADSAKPAAAKTAAGIKPPEEVKPPKITLADKDGLGAQALTKLSKIAENIARAQGHEGIEAIEEVGEQITEEGQAVMVDGQPALVYDGEIHLQNGARLPVTPELFQAMGKFRVARAEADIQRLRPTDAKVAAAFQSVEHNLRAMGIQVQRIIKPLEAHFQGHYGAYLNGKGNVVRIIQVAMTDIHNPTPENYITMLHEAFHALFATEAPEVQAQGHRAIKAMSDEAMGIKGYQEHVAGDVPAEQRPLVQSEGRMAESLGRKLQAEGFDPATASGIVDRLGRLLKDFYHGTLMALARAAHYPVSQELVRKYYENRLRMMAGGDTIRWLNYLGGPRMKLPDWENTQRRGARYSIDKKPKHYVGQLFKNIEHMVTGEAPAINQPAKTSQEAAHHLGQLVYDSGSVFSARGFKVNMHSPDHLAQKQSGATSPLEGRVVHALTERDRTTRDSQKIRSAPLVRDTLQNADLVTHGMIGGGTAPGYFHLKRYNVGGHEFWHAIESDMRGDFVTQYSFEPGKANLRVAASKVVTTGERARAGVPQGSGTPNFTVTPSQASPGPREEDSNTPLPGSQRSRDINPLTNPHQYLETKEGAPIGIAALNHFADLAAVMVRDHFTNGNTGNLSPDEIAEQFIHLPRETGGASMFPPGTTPQSVIADTVHRLGMPPQMAEARLADLPNDMVRQQAAALTHRLLYEWKATMDGAADQAAAQGKRDEGALEKNGNALVRLAKDYVDVDFMGSKAKGVMLGLINEARQAVRGVRDFARKGGAIDQTIRELDKTVKPGDLTPAWRKALDSTYQYLSENGGKFSDTLAHVAELDLDWTKKPGELVAAIRDHFVATNDPKLAVLFTGDEALSKGLLATVAAFGKSNSHVMDLLATRKLEAAGDRLEVNQQLKDMMGATQGKLSEIKQQIMATFAKKNQKLARRMMRLADKMEELRKANEKLQQSMDRSRATVAFTENTFQPALEASAARLEKVAGISFRSFEVAHGAKIPVPNDEGKLEDKTLNLQTDSKRGTALVTSKAEQAEWMRRMSDWLDRVDPGEQGAKYNEVAEALDKLRTHDIVAEHRSAQGTLLERWLAPVQELAFSVGTPAARLVGQGLNKYSSFLRDQARPSQQHGIEFETANLDAARAFGYKTADSRTFWDQRVAPALHDVEQNRERFTMLATKAERTEAAVKHAVGQVKAPNPAARTALEKLIRLHMANNERVVENGARLGNKVRDDYPGNRAVYRPVLGESSTFFPRLLRDVARSFYGEHMAGAWGGDTLNRTKVAELYNHSPQALADSLQARFTPAVWQWFMKSLAYNDRPQFSAPGEGGLAPLATREAVIRAYEGAGGSVVKFAFTG